MLVKCKGKRKNSSGIYSLGQISIKNSPMTKEPGHVR